MFRTIKLSAATATVATLDLSRVFILQPNDVCGKLRATNSGGTIASVLNGFEQIWSGGSEVARKMSNPVLLTSPGVFGMAGSPSGLGYDSVAKCKKKVLGGLGGKRYSVIVSAMRHDDARRNCCACFVRTNRCTRMYGAAASRR